QQYNSLLVNTILEFSKEGPFVELGAGYGSVIFALKHRLESMKLDCKLSALEYTENGRNCIKSLDENRSIVVGDCDFLSTINKSIIRRGSVVYTSMALMMVPIIGYDLIESIIDSDPRIMMFFEAVPDFCDESLIGSLQKRYISLNDYNSNLFDLLRVLESHGKLEIIEVRKNIFAENFLLPTSLIVCTRKRPL
uniref:hypothetical protein n=1 Tax=Rheinheimera sp. TaxID=1869214 RepID=UPI00404729CD